MKHSCERTDMNCDCCKTVQRDVLAHFNRLWLKAFKGHHSLVALFNSHILLVITPSPMMSYLVPYPI